MDEDTCLLSLMVRGLLNYPRKLRLFGQALRVDLRREPVVQNERMKGTTQPTTPEAAVSLQQCSRLF